MGKAHAATDNQVGSLTGIKIEKSGNEGKITSSASNAGASGVGGILGYGEALILMQYNTNTGYILSAAAHKAVGGIAGSLGNDPSGGARSAYLNVQLYKCENYGTIDAQHNSSRVGGILGFMEEGPDSRVDNCANYGKVLGKHQSDNGGIVGYVDHLTNIYDCFNAGNVDNGNAAIGTHKSGSIFNHDGLYYIDGTGKSWPSATKVSKSDAGDKSRYPRLDFDKVWIITSDGPLLRDCPF